MGRFQNRLLVWKWNTRFRNEIAWKWTAWKYVPGLYYTVVKFCIWLEMCTVMEFGIVLEICTVLKFCVILEMCTVLELCTVLKCVLNWNCVFTVPGSNTTNNLCMLLWALVHLVRVGRAGIGLGRFYPSITEHLTVYHDITNCVASATGPVLLVWWEIWNYSVEISVHDGFGTIVWLAR